MDCPLLTIIIPTYNRKNKIRDSIESIVKQTFQNWELIIVDDGSTDGTAIDLETYTTNKKIRYFYKANGGVCSARNFGLQKATGTYVVFLDSDDVAMPLWLQRFAEKSADNTVDLLFCGCTIWRDNKKEEVLPRALGKIYKNITGLFLAGTFCAKKELLLNAGAFDEELKFSENYELGIRLLKDKLNTACINEALVVYYNELAARTSNSLENRLNANLYLLQKYKDEYDKDVLYFSGLMSMTGYLLAHKKKKKEALRYYMQCLKMRPFYGKNIYRILSLLK